MSVQVSDDAQVLDTIDSNETSLRYHAIPFRSNITENVSQTKRAEGNLCGWKRNGDRFMSA